MSTTRLHVAITADGARPDGWTMFGDLGLERLVEAGADWSVLPRYVDPLPPADLADVDTVLSLGHTRFGHEIVDALPRLRHIARFGAGVESIDLDACTAAGVVVTNTPDGVRRPLALAALTLVLALAHNLPAKDRITRSGAWAERSSLRGHGVDGKVLGIIGFGSVGADLADLAAGLGFTVIGSNRSGRSVVAERLGVDLLPVDDVIARSDYVVLTASLNDESRGMIDARRLALLKPSAYLVNVARGALIDQNALTEALLAGSFAGAGLDVFDPEPIGEDDPLLALDTVILSPHSLPWTEEFTRDVSASAITAILDVAAGRTPRHLVNPGVLTSEAWLRRTPAVLR